MTKKLELSLIGVGFTFGKPIIIGIIGHFTISQTKYYFQTKITPLKPPPIRPENC